MSLATSTLKMHAISINFKMSTTERKANFSQQNCNPEKETKKNRQTKNK